MQYEIHEDFYPEVEKKLKRVAKKCAKYGNDFVFEIVGDKMRKDRKKPWVYHRFIVVEVEGTAKINGWEFIGVMEIMPGGNIIRLCNTEIEVPERFYHSANVCDHCHTERKRNNLYIIRNTETGEFHQVGGHCLNLYTNGLDMENVASWLDGIAELEEFDGVFYTGSGTKYSAVEDVLQYATVIIEKMGYLKVDNYGDNLSTKQLVTNMLGYALIDNRLDTKVDKLNEMLRNHRYNDVSFSKSDFVGNAKYNSELDKKVESIIAYYKSLEPNSTFIHNIQTIIDAGCVSYNNLGIMCYCPEGYFKHQEREIERAKRAQLKHEYWGEIGKRYKNIPVKEYKRVASYETDYGLMMIWNIVLQDDTVLTWKTSNYISDDTTAISFTVKDHSDYKGTKQTIITRCTQHHSKQAFGDDKAA
jgi:hypothetical protein